MKKILIILIAMMVMAAPAQAATVDELEARINELEARVAVLEELLGLGQQDEATENEGYFCLVNGSGSTEDGDTIIIYCDTPDTTYTQIGLEGWGMDGSLKSFVYVDGELNDTYQLSDTQTSLGLTGPALYPGTHEVTIKQYPGNDETAEPSFVQTEEYTVEE